jgi:multisubunit Na+/H+ antiporter MnhC subunit
LERLYEEIALKAMAGDLMLLGVYSDAKDQRIGGGWMTLVWLASGPLSCITLLRLSLASTTKVVQGSNRGEFWRLAQAADPIGYKIMIITTLVIFIGSSLFFLFGLFRICRFFTTLHDD